MCRGLSVGDSVRHAATIAACCTEVCADRLLHTLLLPRNLGVDCPKLSNCVNSKKQRATTVCICSQLTAAALSAVELHEE